MEKIEFKTIKDRQFLLIPNLTIPDLFGIFLGIDYRKGVVVLFDRDCHPSVMGYCLYWVYNCAWIAMAYKDQAEAVVIKSWITGYSSGQVIQL